MLKKIQNIISIVLIITLLPVITGCDSKEQKILNKQYVQQARKNAVEYIENKYGFTPDIISDKQERSPGMFHSTPLSTVLVKMKYEDKTFNVYIDGENENTDGKDNYQFNEIKDGMKKFADNVLYGIKNIKLDSDCVANGTNIEIEDRKNMYKKYYDGSNILEVITDNDSTTVTFEYIETDLSSVADWSSFENIFKYDSFVKLRFISYRSENAMHSCEKYVVNTNPSSAIYIDNYCTLSNWLINYDSNHYYSQEYEIETESYELEESNGFYYYVSGSDFDNVSFSEITPEDPSCWNGRGAIDAVFVSPEFSVNAEEECNIFVYYPVSEIDFHNEKEVRLAKSYTLNGKKEYCANSLSDYNQIGNYAVFNINIGGKSKFDNFCFGFIESHKK